MANAELRISWQDYLAIGLRRKWFFVVPVSIGVVCAAVFCVISPRIFGASALIAVQDEKLINPLIAGLAMPTAISDRLNTLREEILSWTNLTRLIEAHRLDQDIPKNDPIQYEKLVDRLREDIGVRLKGKSLIEVSYEGRDPAKVQEVVNSLTDIVIERDEAIREKEAHVAVSFIEEELSVYRQKLEESEQNLRKFKELYMTQMPVATALNSQLKDLEVMLSTLMVANTPEHPRVVEVKRQIDAVKRQRDEEVRRLVSRGVIGDQDPKLQEDLLKQLALVEQASGPVDAAVQKARDAYAAVVQGLESPERLQATGAQIAMNAEGGTTVQMGDAAATLTLAPRQQQELAKLTRDYSVNESIYRGLLEKLEKAKITGRLGEDDEGGKFVIIERARFPLKPIKPDILRTILIAVMLGIAVGAGLVVLVEYMDQSIQSADEVGELLQLPVLGTISTILTEYDLLERRQRRKSWLSVRQLTGRLAQPLWSRIDQVLVRWGL